MFYMSNNRHSLLREAATVKVSRKCPFFILTMKVLPFECFAVYDNIHIQPVFSVQSVVMV